MIPPIHSLDKRVDAQITLNLLFDNVGIELIDMLAAKIDQTSSNQEIVGGKLEQLAYRSAANKLRFAYSSLVFDLMINEFTASVTKSE